MKVRFTKPALAELDAIFAYIHQHNPVAAGQVVARIREITSQLGRFPDMGHQKYKPGVRMITVRRYPYLIFYTVEKDEVLILSVRHGARQLFDEESAVGVATIRRAELAGGETSMTAANDLAIRRALELAGVEFIDENGGGAGVRLRKGAKEKPRK